MLIYILHSDRIYTFRLPKEVSGNYILTDYDSDGHIRNLTNISAIDNKWYINSNVLWKEKIKHMMNYLIHMSS